MKNSIEMNGLIISVVALILTAIGLIVTLIFSIIAYKTSKQVNKNNEIINTENKYQIDKKKLIIKTWNEMKNAFERYSILVPKSKYSDKDSFDYWENIVQLFRTKNIIYQSVKIFFHKFEGNWENIDKIATSGLRKELEKLEIEEIEEIFKFWAKINKKLDIIDPIIEKLKILEINYGRTKISSILKKNTNLEDFYINLCPESHKFGLWGYHSKTSFVFDSELPYSKTEFDILIKKENEDFEEEINSKKWNLEISFTHPTDKLLKYIFSVKYENNEIINIKSDLDEQPYPLHKNDFCNCDFEKQVKSKETLNNEEKEEVDKIILGLIYLSKLLKINIFEYIPFLKNDKDSKCLRTKYLKSKLE